MAPKLTPVDYDPFAAPSRSDGSYAPVQTPPGYAYDGTMSPEARQMQPRYDEPIPSQPIPALPPGPPQRSYPVDYNPFQPVNQGADLRDSAHGGLEQGVAGLLGFPEQALHSLDWLSDSAAHKLGILDDAQLKRLRASEGGGLPSTEWVQSQIARVDPGVNYVPRTPLGHLTHTASSMAPGALVGGGSAAQRIASVLGGAVASDTAGALTEGTQAEPIARFAGALAGGGIGHFGSNAVGDLAGTEASQSRLLAGALKDVPPDQIAQAQALMTKAQAAGIKLTPAEALQQVSGGTTGMGRVQRAVESSPQGGQKMAPMMAARPQQVRQAVTGLADQVAPGTEQPSFIGTRAQGAAQRVLDNVRGNINASAKPFYDALEGQTIPGYRIDPRTGATMPGFNDLTKDPSFAQALAEVRGNPELNGPIAHLPDNDLAVVNEVSKHLDTSATGARQTVMNPKGNNRLAGLRGSAKDIADALATEVAPEYGQARQTVASGRQAFLDPLEAGPVGQIAKPDRTIPQYKSLFPAQPLEGGAQETSQAMGLLNAVDPQVGPSLMRQHLVNSLNEATQDLPSGANPYGGAKFAAQIAGNPEQSRTLDLAMQQTGGAPLAERSRDLIEALSATGKRLPPGGGEFDVTGGSPVSKAAGVALEPWLWPRRAAGAYQHWAAGRNSSRLADLLLAEPDVASSTLGNAAQASKNDRATLLRLLLQSDLATQGAN